MRKSDLMFHELGHTYYVGEQRIKSVTQIISTVYPSNHSQYYTEHSRQRGKAVHKATELYDHANLDESTVHPDIVGYVNAYKKAKHELRIKILETEVMIYHEQLGFCGRLDKIGRSGEVYGKNIIEIKTGVKQDNDLLQTAGYLLGLEDDEVNGRLILYLKENGRYDVDWCANSSDITDFAAVLTTYKRGIRNGYYKNQ